jgi:hypothetical protein
MNPVEWAFLFEFGGAGLGIQSSNCGEGSGKVNLCEAGLGMMDML